MAWTIATADGDVPDWQGKAWQFCAAIQERSYATSPLRIANWIGPGEQWPDDYQYIPVIQSDLRGWDIQYAGTYGGAIPLDTISWVGMQAKIEGMINDDCWILVDARECDPYHQSATIWVWSMMDTSSTPVVDPWPDIKYLNIWASIYGGNYVEGTTESWRATKIHPDDEAFEGWEYRRMARGDIIGPWIFKDLFAVLIRMRWTIKQGVFERQAGWWENIQEEVNWTFGGPNSFDSWGEATADADPGETSWAGFVDGSDPDEFPHCWTSGTKTLKYAAAFDGLMNVYAVTSLENTLAKTTFLLVYATEPNDTAGSAFSNGRLDGEDGRDLVAENQWTVWYETGSGPGGVTFFSDVGPFGNAGFGVDLENGDTSWCAAPVAFEGYTYNGFRAGNIGGSSVSLGVHPNDIAINTWGMIWISD